jgi:hypothetical protein
LAFSGLPAAHLRCGWVLADVPEVLLTEAICREAVRNSAKLCYVPFVMRTEAVCFAAVRQNSDALEYVPAAWRTEILAAVALE